MGAKPPGRVCSSEDRSEARGEMGPWAGLQRQRRQSRGPRTGGGAEGAQGGWDHVSPGSVGKVALAGVLITKERVLMGSISTQVSCFFCQMYSSVFYS